MIDYNVAVKFSSRGQNPAGAKDVSSVARRIAILGSTGSVGTQTLAVAEAAGKRLTVCALAARSDVRALEDQARRFRPRLAVLADETRAAQLRVRLRDLPVRVAAGPEGLLEAATATEADAVVIAVSGCAGLEPALAALEAGKRVALANKETLVAAGDLVMATARRKKAEILPVDSEHSAIFQALRGGRRTEVRKLILTASGGPFLGWSAEELKRVTPEEALCHPRWRMGPKITVDSATMMNKALEVIEARFLFDMPYEKIEVIIHPQSIVHSMVEFVDGAVLAQAGAPDMRLPIQYALSYPRRWPLRSAPVLDGETELTFIRPEKFDFPALALGRRCALAGGTVPAAMNAANEVFVRAFLDGRIRFTEIVPLTGEVAAAHEAAAADTLTAVLAAEQWARRRAEEMLAERDRGGAAAAGRCKL
ncbi:MAG: 1-deoxy-D-xylulose-5-phosphate reductoisomerase [Gracilibacteraceae bacterium]|jgi:1-deoxy-D-xylulose-5-phosphate reductoisomerase|nr:1-deoxy-D-xylulose-5-phosphate reductoisomerase [Gracilibacteraceae bacterium]